jgi:hypothetical protein
VWPGERLSYQQHFRREEHWTVVQGEALITLNDGELRRVSGEAIDIPREARHQLANPGASDLVVIAVQRGDYLGEDDIVRRQDNYGRAQTAVRVDGEVKRALTFGFVGLAALPEQVTDVGSCNVESVNTCTNVKELDHIRITVGPAAGAGETPALPIAWECRYETAI